MQDAQLAIGTGVHGLDIVFGTSSILREHSHGKDMAYIIETAQEVIKFVKSKGLEVRFSSEDSFRSDWDDLVALYTAVDRAGVDRVGIADTVGCANPRQVFDVSLGIFIPLVLLSGSRLVMITDADRASQLVQKLRNIVCMEHAQPS